MKYHLQKFDSSVNDNTVYGIEVGEIIDEIKQSAFSIRSKHELKLFIQNHQKTLLKFKGHKPIGLLADEILHFLEIQFPNAVNDKLQVSDKSKQEFWLKYAENILLFRPKIKAVITDNLYKSIQTLMEPESTQNLSIYNLKYLYNFWDNWPMSKHSTIDKEKIMLYLISQNFNASCFFRYITRGIIYELSQEHRLYFQMQILYSYERKLRTVFAKLNQPFNIDNTAIQPKLQDWLDSELKHCTKALENLNQNQHIKHLENPNKIETSLSVTQTAYFFKLLYQTGIIINKAQTDMLHVVSEKFSTPKSHTISYESLHNKYYNVEDSAREAVHQVLKDLVKNSK